MELVPKTSTALPVHVQIREALIREIAAGRLPPGDRLPPERGLAAQYGTTVRTLRKALADLAEQGLLDRVQGSGNYVRRNDRPRSIYSFFRLERPEGGGLPTADIVEVLERRKPADLPPFGLSERATRIRRVRRLDRIPVATEEIWLDRACGEVRLPDLSESLYLYYREHLGFWIRRIEDQVSLGYAPEWATGHLECAADAPVGFIERLSWAQHEHPVEYSRTWFDPERARYVQRLS
ncbi:MAG: GntR family transcriptional regulator [Pseudomonadota bacterium]